MVVKWFCNLITKPTVAMVIKKKNYSSGQFDSDNSDAEDGSTPANPEVKDRSTPVTPKDDNLSNYFNIFPKKIQAKLIPI